MAKGGAPPLPATHCSVEEVLSCPPAAPHSVAISAEAPGRHAQARHASARHAGTPRGDLWKRDRSDTGRYVIARHADTPQGDLWRRDESDTGRSWSGTQEHRGGT